MSAPTIPLAVRRTSPLAGWLTGARSTWQLRYARSLFALDVLVLSATTAVGLMARFGLRSTADGVPYAAVAVGITAFWLVFLAAARCYEPRTVLDGSREVLQTVRASAEAFSLVSLVSFLTDTEFSRLYVCLVFAVGTLALIGNRLLVHHALATAREHGRAQHRVVVVGDADGVQALHAALHQGRRSGHVVVGACLIVAPDETGADLDLPTVRGAEHVAQLVAELGADTVAVSSGGGIDRSLVARISAQLEGTGLDLLIAPSLADVAGTRVSVRPVAGLPLVHVDEPELDGVHKLIKSAFDRSCAALGMLLILPVLVTLWAAIRLTSEGPAIFKQPRVGRDGKVFLVWKFRSMYPDAEARLAELQHLNEGGGPLFKMKNDPRVTPIGRILRKWSLDELPQLVNVLKGDMSLVGPRPPLPSEVALYDGHTHRRLLVKPGITGLWQVSGRSDLSWEQSVRLDLSYVDSWSLGLDIAILARTALAVVRSSGAY